ncbi:MAG: KpsF/GutQ family sugar-phosphate isomerase [Alphaproteobacteria bacterium]|nr:MAG: KpsF/GutQ family sugar-phosphate isomerase [Alphaproteobacteria bacterium]
MPEPLPFGLRSCRAFHRAKFHHSQERAPVQKPLTSEGTTRSGDLIASALRTLEAEAGGIGTLSAAICNGLGPDFIAAVELISSARGRLIVTGMGKSGHVARKVAATFASTGTPAFFVHPGEASHGDLGMITPDDVIMALSWSGETAELKDLIDYSRRFRIGLIAITAAAESTLAAAADIVLALPNAREACPHNLAPTTSTLMQAALGDALAVALLESRGFTAVDFGKLHPGGRLGAMLKFAADVMHSGDAIPLVALGTAMADALVEMSSKGFGCVGITDANGNLMGIITDGDLRPHMRPNLLEARVDDVMTRSPKTIRPDQLASEALELINSSKITTVAEGGKPVGIVHFHDLLRAGIA